MNATSGEWAQDMAQHASNVHTAHGRYVTGICTHCGAEVGESATKLDGRAHIKFRPSPDDAWRCVDVLPTSADGDFSRFEDFLRAATRADSHGQWVLL